MFLVVLAFVLPFLTLYLTRKRPLPQMVGWAAGITAAYYLFLFLVRPALEMLQWKSSVTWLDIVNYWGTEWTMGTYVLAFPALVTVVGILIVISLRRKK